MKKSMLCVLPFILLLILNATFFVKDVSGQQPDLIIQSITTDPASPPSGEIVLVTATFKNQGTAPTGSTFYIDFYKDRDTAPPSGLFGDCARDITETLNPGQTGTETCAFIYEDCGTFKMWAQIDSDGIIVESNESNNIFGPQNITVDCSKPDLIVQSITTDPVSPIQGQTVNITYTFKNQGSAPATNFYVDFYKDRDTAPTLWQGGECYVYITEPLNPGQTRTANCTVVYEDCGTFKMWALIDTGNVIDELDKSNNILGPQNITVNCLCPGYNEIRSLVREYYRDILDREPDKGGWDYWTDEICRIQSLGIYLGEGFQAEARFFFNSQEYMDKGKSDKDFVIDLYQTFLQREPDEAGLKFWVGELSCLTRNMLITQFAYSDEFKQYMTNLFGPDTTRPENNMVNDFYRGFMSRFPDDGGYNSWLTAMRQAQCKGAKAVQELSYQLTLLFVNSAEYKDRKRDNVEYVEDLYNGILRRGADCEGFLAWVKNLNAGMSREEMLKLFTDSPEFQTRVDAVIAVGCIVP